MQNLATQRCFNHALREAVARCPQCANFFCRECITEHDDRVICAACLGKLARKSPLPRRTFAGLMHAAQCLLGIMLAWFFFYLIGEGLLSLPTSFHEGILWKANWWNEE
jgi:uncharacterized paraquat-inducible protein A